MKLTATVISVAVGLSACAAQVPAPDAATATDAALTGLACALASNCVSTQGSGAIEPLRYQGTPAQAMALLQATLSGFAEARTERSEPLAMTLIFTTPAGFKDQVDFLIHPQAQRIDFRSRSLFGLFDWGKNRARMQDIRARFDQQARR
jgi:uncharacterized protein (DUF1499 family)